MILGSTSWWEDAEGTRSAVEAFTLSSSIEAGLSFDEDSAVVTVAGTHDLAVTAEDAAGETQSATDTVEVAAGAAVDVSLTLSADVVPAGEPVTATIAATDAYTNPASTEGAVLTVSDGASADDTELVATAVGEYSVTVALDELSDEAQWSVTAGAPATIDLVVESNAVEVGDATDVEVIVLDAYGNTAEADLTWSLDPGAVLEEDF